MLLKVLPELPAGSILLSMICSFSFKLLLMQGYPNDINPNQNQTSQFHSTYNGDLVAI